MSRQNYIFTSESVSEGHPDKVCDRISDAVLDAFMAADPHSRVACETFATTDRVVVGGEVRGPGEVIANVEQIARDCVKDIGYEQEGFHWANMKVDSYLHAQSADIAQGVDASGNKDEGAGDQGIMFGYAVNETPELMPAPILYSHAMLRRLAEVRKTGVEPALGPDAKSQLTVRYVDGAPVGVASIVLSTQHLDASLSSDDVRAIVAPYITEVLPEGWITADTEWHVNPTGKFVIGGPDGDAGLTGRKIIVDTYGGAAPHGGGAFSGKDPTKVDRSASYAARWVAKNVVAAGLADRFEVELAYGIGIPEPVSISVDSFGTGTIEDHEIQKLIERHFDLRPGGIISALDLWRPIYKQTAAYGHFGRNEPGFTWERTDRVEALQAALG